MELQTHPHNENRSTQKDETEDAFFSQQFSKWKSQAPHVEHLDYFEVDPTKMVGILPSMKEKTTFKRD